MTTSVWFNDEQIELFEQLVKAGAISQSFANFVKDAFHDKIDGIRAKRGATNGQSN
jgi:hypothetical protein